MRAASHAGTWYTNNSNTLRQQLQNWLDQAQPEYQQPPKAIIGPQVIKRHAGYRYSGPAAAWGYKLIQPNSIQKVFLFGPSHHVYLEGCGLPASFDYQTPIGNLPVDQEIVRQLESTGKFQKLNRQVEEDEHSLEMHLPYIRQIFQGQDIHLIPIMVGKLSQEQERSYAQVFAEFLNDPSAIFIVSSDFCHWGSRFRYQHYDQDAGEIWQSIEQLDREGIELIENLDLEGFKRYLEAKGNTICGRNPIILLLNIIQQSQQGIRGHLMRYEQSEKVKNQNDSSVSYVSMAFY